MNLVLVGTSHRLAPVEVRERVALDLEGSAELARRLADGGEAVCLSTCNRTELYLAHGDPEQAERLAGAALADGEIELYRLRDEAAALHLFRVAAGLDSLVPGEGEILGQVRAAYEAGACGPVLDRLFRQALHSGKKVRAETAIGESPASVSSAAAALAQQVFGELEGCRVLLVGAGEVSELAARSLAARGASISAVTSRTQERAEELARRFGAQAVPFEQVGDELARADVVVSSTSAPGYVLTADLVPERKGRPLFVIDLAVPRDVEPAVADLDDCYLYDIDDLEAVVSESLSGRWREAARAESIVAHEAERFRDWQASLDVVPAIASLRERAESIRSGELAKAAGRLDGLSESERRTVESLTTQIVNKLLHVPIVRLKEAAATEGSGYVDAARHLFGLGRGRAMLDRVGSRGSRLALTQAALACDRLRGPGIEIALIPITTAGDRDRTKPFGEIGERGVFVKELEEALLDGRIDVAVHSAKDMTSTDTDGLVVGAYPPREDPRDALCGAEAVRPEMRIGTASVRRRAQLLALEPTLSIEPLRGNIDTRLRKRGERGLDAVVLAACGLDRLGLGDEIGHRFEPEELLPEAGQGALALQVRVGEEELVAAANDPETHRRVSAERRCVGLIGGGASRRSRRTTTVRP